MERMRGTLGVESSLGAGSPILDGIEWKLMNNRISVLVAEDNPDDIFLLERAVNASRFDLQILPDGEEVIQHLSRINQAELPAIILLDLKMPRRSGHDTLEWIRAHAIYWRIVVLIVTSSEEPSDIEKARKLGANSYLLKPGTYNEFRIMIEALQNYWISHDYFVRTVNSAG